jgi:hypothetical protein
VATDNRKTTRVKFGYPDGPKVFVPELGCEEPSGTKPASRLHVPLKCRGPLRPESLTCSPDRYRSVAAARHIELNA